MSQKRPICLIVAKVASNRIDGRLPPFDERLRPQWKHLAHNIGLHQLVVRNEAQSILFRHPKKHLNVSHEICVVLDCYLKQLATIFGDPGLGGEQDRIGIENECADCRRLSSRREFDELLHDPTSVSVASTEPFIQASENRVTKDVLVIDNADIRCSREKRLQSFRRVLLCKPRPCAFLVAGSYEGHSGERIPNVAPGCCDDNRESLEVLFYEGDDEFNFWEPSLMAKGVDWLKKGNQSPHVEGEVFFPETAGYKVNRSGRKPEGSAIASPQNSSKAMQNTFTW